MKTLNSETPSSGRNAPGTDNDGIDMGNLALTPSQITDVQGSQDKRNIAINKVGIKDIRHPVIISDRSRGAQHTVANFNMYVGLPHHFKGTHMSRFIEILNNHEHEITVDSFKNMISEVVSTLDAESGHVEMSFPYFVEKSSPVSGVKSLLDYQVSLIGEIENSGQPSISIKILVPVTSLCPCSKKISEYGAHNQRSHVTITTKSRQSIWIEEIIDTVEAMASCQLYSLLKRSDEKYVTEYAYNNPKFVEDIVRDIAVALNRDERILDYTIETENFESIHNHSAYAKIVKSRS